MYKYIYKIIHILIYIYKIIGIDGERKRERTCSHIFIYIYIYIDIFLWDLGHVVRIPQTVIQFVARTYHRTTTERIGSVAQQCSGLRSFSGNMIPVFEEHDPRAAWS